MNVPSAYKELHMKTQKDEITHCVLPSCTINMSIGVTGGEADVSFFPLMTMTWLSKSPFQHPKPSIYTFLLLQKIQGFPLPFLLLPPRSSLQFVSGLKRQSRSQFCITSSPLLHYCGHLACIQIARLWYYVKKQEVHQENSSVVLYHSCGSVWRAADWLTGFGLGYKAAFVEQPFLRLFSLIRSVDFQKVIALQGHEIAPSFVSWTTLHPAFKAMNFHH